MRLETLIETIRAHRPAAEDCARQLAMLAADFPEGEAVRGFRTALAVGVLDESFGRRLATELEKIVGTPDAVVGELPEMRAIEEELVALASRQEGARADLDGARRLREQIERQTRELAELTAQATAAAAAAEAAGRRVEEKQALLVEVGDGRHS